MLNSSYPGANSPLAPTKRLLCSDLWSRHSCRADGNDGVVRCAAEGQHDSSICRYIGQRQHAIDNRTHHVRIVHRSRQLVIHVSIADCRKVPPTRYEHCKLLHIRSARL